jgi:hypothetical protein
VQRDPQALARLIDRLGITYMQVGTFVHQLLSIFCFHLHIYIISDPNEIKTKHTHTQATPATLELLTAGAALDDDERGWAPPSRLTLLVGGEAYRPSLLPLARTASAVFNGYGACMRGCKPFV